MTLPGIFRILRFPRRAGQHNAAMARVQAAEQALKPVTGAMERRFLSCGTALENLTTGSLSLTRDSSELLRLASKEEAAGAVEQATAILTEPIAFFDQHVARLHRHAVALKQAHAALGAVLARESDLQSAVAPLRATRTMFRVEASRLAEADQAAFVDLADQIESLHDRVRGVFAEEFAKLSETREVLTSVCLRVDTESTRQGQQLASEKRQIEDALTRLHAELEHNASREDSLRRHSAAVSDAVARVVVALQSQDIVAQITQHLLEGLDRLRAHHSEEPSRLQALVEMQRRRAANALDQIETSSASMTASASAVLEALGEPDSQDSLEQGFSGISRSIEGAIQVLVNIADRIREMSRAAVALGEETLERISPLNQVTTALSDSVDRLSHQMNLVALNAQIQAVRIDAGTGLEVLAAHTASVATAAAQLGESIREGLEQFQQILKAESAEMAEGIAEAQQRRAELEEKSGAQWTALDQAREGVVQSMAALSAGIGQVRAAAAAVAEASVPDRAEQQSFVEMRDSLVALASRLASLPGVSEERVRAHLEEDDHHAIAAERENHLKIAGALNGVPENSMEDDNSVELF